MLVSLLSHTLSKAGDETGIKSWNVLVRNDMNVNEHERLSNFTLRHKLK